MCNYLRTICIMFKKIETGWSSNVCIYYIFVFIHLNGKDEIRPKHQRKNVKKALKMLGLYLFTLVIGHKPCNTLSILNKLTL